MLRRPINRGMYISTEKYFQKPNDSYKRELREKDGLWNRLDVEWYCQFATNQRKLNLHHGDQWWTPEQVMEYIYSDPRRWVWAYALRKKMNYYDKCSQ